MHVHNLQPFKPVLRGALGGECLHLRPPPRAGPSPSAAHPSDGGDEPGPAIPACSPTALGAPAGAQDSEWGGSGAAAGRQDPAIWGERG